MFSFGLSRRKKARLEEFRLKIKRRRRYRVSLDDVSLEAGSRVILLGESDELRDAAQLLEAKKICPVNVPIPNRQDVSPSTVVTLSDYSEQPQLPAVFVGTPRKHQFSSTRAFGQSMMWMYADKVPKRKSRLADDQLFKKYAEHLYEVYTILEDESSRAALQSIIASRYFNDNGYLKISNYKEYGHPVAKVREGDVVVDAGAHVGKVTKEFALQAGRSGNVFAFEPDEKNFAELTQRTTQLPQVVPVQKGIWSKTATLSFDNEGNTSAGYAINENGQSLIQVTSLDDFFAEQHNRPPTVIKFDIEGAEAEALEGSANLIREHKPRLMISAYHKPADLWELLFKVREMRPDYKFYLGHHNFYHTETDIYAV